MGDSYTYYRGLKFADRIEKRIKYYEYRLYLRRMLCYANDKVALKRIETLKDLLRITFGVRGLKGE